MALPSPPIAQQGGDIDVDQLYRRIALLESRSQDPSSVAITGGAIGALTAIGPWVTVKQAPFSAAGDGTTNDSAAFQAAIDAMNALGGGTIYVPEGNYRVSNVRTYTAVTLRGPGAKQYGFNGTGRNATIKTVAGASTNAIVGVLVTAGGSGYATAPTVAFSGGGGSGATATANISGGVVTGITITDSGAGYTAAPTVVFSGGGGSGATATATVAATIFYTTGASVMGVGFEGLNFQGLNSAGTPDAGIVLHNSTRSRITNCHFYNFWQECISNLNGGTLRLRDCDIFGLFRQSSVDGSLYPSGAVRLGGNDNYMDACEIGSTPSTDNATMPNAALYYNGSALMATNSVFELSDLGARLVGSTGAFTNCRADLNYCHGWYVTRDDAGIAPPNYNSLTNCWGHRNSQRTTNTYDNFRIESGKSIQGVMLTNCRSSFSSGDGWAHRYGFYDGGTATQAANVKDLGALTKWYEGAANYSGPHASFDNASTTLSGTSIDMTARQFARISNGSATNLATITGGVEGQVIYLQTMNANTTIVHNTSSIATNTAANKATVQNGIYIFRYVLGTWWEVAP